MSYRVGKYRRERIYFNTSLLIRAVNPWERGHRRTLEFIRMCRDRGYVLVVSNVLYMERFRKKTLERIRDLLDEYGFMVATVDTDRLLYRAVEWVRRHRYSESRVLDVMHLMAAETLKCKYIAAVDRFIKRNARKFNLVYINYYIGVP